MADYIYLLENRLSRPQKNALNIVREISREKGLTLFLVGGAVRDLTSGSPVRDLDVVVQSNVFKLQKDIERHGGVVVGENDTLQALYVTFPGGAKVEVGSALSLTYPKPGKPVAKPANILDDLRRRDFTANAMALSLNTGSYGLLMDPLNGVADIENRELRLVSNYGFIEDPIRMIRAVRLMARLGWQMDEKTQARYATGKEEGYISAASAFQRGYEIEEIVHEEDPLRIMRGLEAEGWMEVLTPNWNSSKANVAELERLRESQTQLQMQGIHPNTAAANFPLLTAKLSAKEAADLKATFARQGFVREVEALDGEAKEFASQFSAKSASLPSQSWKLLYSAKPEAVLMVAHSSKSPAIQAKFKSFYTEWPLARQKVPYSLLQEMRITPELPDYEQFVESVFFQLMDGHLGTVEEMKAFLEPFSPPAPPPPVHLRRARAAKKEAKSGKGRAKKAAVEAVSDDGGKGAHEAEHGIGARAAAQVTEAVAEVTLPAAKPAKEPLKSIPVTATPPTKAATVKAENEPAKKTLPAVKKPVQPVKAGPAKKPIPSKAVVKTVAKKAVAAKSVVAKPVAATKKLIAKAVAAKKPSPKAVPKKAVAKKALPKSLAKSAGKKTPVKAQAVARKTAAKPAARAGDKRR